MKIIIEFQPQKDITTYELAICLSMIHETHIHLRTNIGIDITVEALKKYSKTITRHFKLTKI